MKHIIAYGNSDQASFREEDVRQSLNYLLVPGTIASYYPDATAGFVLTSGLEYLIDPRTPLFQGHLTAPRASHLTLAAAHGSRMDQEIQGGGNFGESFYGTDVLQEMVRSVIDYQRNYAGRGDQVQSKMQRYRALLAEANSTVSPELDKPGDPSFILIPYFACETASDAWAENVRSMWTIATNLPQPARLSAVAAGSSVEVVASLVDDCPTDLSKSTFFWIADFDERAVDIGKLEALAQFVRDRSGARDLINLYGGFFSICLAKVGLWAFNNGLGYSESRSWPDLPQTGAAPPRYYIRELHRFFSPAVAQSIVEADQRFVCPCPVCSGGQSIIGLSYHALKRHFALARNWEIEIVATNNARDIAASLLDAHNALEHVSNQLPPQLLPESAYLERWASVIETL